MGPAMAPWALPEFKSARASKRQWCTVPRPLNPTMSSCRDGETREGLGLGGVISGISNWNHASRGSNGVRSFSATRGLDLSPRACQTSLFKTDDGPIGSSNRPMVVAWKKGWNSLTLGLAFSPSMGVFITGWGS